MPSVSRSWRAARWAAALLVLTGCASLGPIDHPQAWRASPAADLAHGCPDLSGTYSTRPAEVYPEGLAWRPSLDEALRLIVLRDTPNDKPKEWPEVAGATKAVLTSRDEWLFVALRDDGAGEAGVRFKRKNWWGGLHEGSDAMHLCVDRELGPSLLFEGARRPLWAVPFGTGQPAWFGEMEFDSVILSKASDGSLIVNYRTGRMLLTTILIGSYGRWAGSVWWRYPPARVDR